MWANKGEGQLLRIPRDPKGSEVIYLEEDGKDDGLKEDSRENGC